MAIERESTKRAKMMVNAPPTTHKLGISEKINHPKSALAINRIAPNGIKNVTSE